jgi:hypothetical protein
LLCSMSACMAMRRRAEMDENPVLVPRTSL